MAARLDSACAELLIYMVFLVQFGGLLDIFGGLREEMLAYQAIAGRFDVNGSYEVQSLNLE
eukprot:m.286454 g.286454  ORF g.286454 m.286454 type:complete len:61 (+) comp19438_c2_seq2:19-201(+)